MVIDLSRYRIQKDELEDYSRVDEPDAKLVLGDTGGDVWIEDTTRLGLGLKSIIGYISDEVGPVPKIPAEVFVKRLKSLGLLVPDLSPPPPPELVSVDESLTDEKAGGSDD